MERYHDTAKFDLIYAMLQRSVVYQRLIFEQQQAQRPLTEKEIGEIWDDEISNIGESASLAKDEILKIYGEDAVE